MKKAMIFAAGLGTRLQHLTSDKPKALVEFKGKTFLENSLNYLSSYGITDVIINVHHFANKVIQFLDENNNFGMRITISDESDALLDTGGGLLKAAPFFKDEESFLVYNVDIVTDLNLTNLYNNHSDSKAIATLAVRKRETSRYLLFDDDNVLNGWENIKTGEVRMSRNNATNLNRFAFSGIHIINTNIFNLINSTGKFSIIDTYLNLATKHKISSFDHSETLWFDLGKPENILEAEKMFLE